jgi:hypothetical protein
METFGRRTHIPRIRLRIGAALLNAAILSAAVSTVAQTLSLSRVQHIEVPVATSGFHPEAHQTHTFVFPEIIISAQDNDSSSIILTISDQRSDLVKAVKLPNGFGGQIEDVRLFQGRLAVVTAMVGADLHGVVIVDIAAGSIVDHFKCYSPTISPDGRYVSFVKLYPSHGIASAEDHYMVYDVAASPATNRPPDANPSHPHPNLVGLCVYPEGIGNKPDDNIELPKKSQHSMASEGFYWNPDSRSFVFADRYGYGSDYTVVLVRAEAGGFKVETAPLPIRDLCASGPPNNCFFVLAHASFPKSAEQGIGLTFRGVMGTPDFRRHFLFTPRTHAVVLERTENY